MHVSLGTRLRAAVLGIGWWSGVLADAAKRSGEIELVACYTRTEEKRDAFAARYGCRAASSYEEILQDRSIEAIINTTPNDAHLETTRMAARVGKHVFLDKPIANTVADGRAIAEECTKAGVVLALGSQRRRESQFRWIKSEIDASVATVWVALIFLLGATRRPACQAALSCRLAFITSMCWKCSWGLWFACVPDWAISSCQARTRTSVT